MIVCSCNVLCDRRIRAELAKPDCPTRLSDIYRCLGCRAKCGRCARTILELMRESAPQARPSTPLAPVVAG